MNQKKKTKQNFLQAKRILGTNASARNIVAINGCCYGQEKIEDKGDHLKKMRSKFLELYFWQ